MLIDTRRSVTPKRHSDGPKLILCRDPEHSKAWVAKLALNMDYEPGSDDKDKKFDLNRDFVYGDRDGRDLNEEGCGTVVFSENIQDDGVYEASFYDASSTPNYYGKCEGRIYFRIEDGELVKLSDKDEVKALLSDLRKADHGVPAYVDDDIPF